MNIPGLCHCEVLRTAMQCNIITTVISHGTINNLLMSIHEGSHLKCCLICWNAKEL